jgi:hypothetical protein
LGILWCKIPNIFRQWRNMVGSIFFVLRFSKSADDLGFFGEFLTNFPIKFSSYFDQNHW